MAITFFTIMTKSWIFFCFSLIITINAAAQIKTDSLIITRTIKNIVFVSNMTPYSFTRVIQHDGAFGFTDYPIDSLFKRNNIVEKSYFPGKTRYTNFLVQVITGSAFKLNKKALNIIL